jgi:hypothetical protein
MPAGGRQQAERERALGLDLSSRRSGAAAIAGVTLSSRAADALKRRPWRRAQQLAAACYDLDLVFPSCASPRAARPPTTRTSS